MTVFDFRGSFFVLFILLVFGAAIKMASIAMLFLRTSPKHLSKALTVLDICSLKWSYPIDGQNARVMLRFFRMDKRTSVSTQN